MIPRKKPRSTWKSITAKKNRLGSRKGCTRVFQTLGAMCTYYVVYVKGLHSKLLLLIRSQFGITIVLHWH